METRAHRVGMLGTVAKDRDSYDPLSVLSTIRGVERKCPGQPRPSQGLEKYLATGNVPAGQQ